MELNPEAIKLMREWADITEERLVQSLDKKRIGQSGQLKTSLDHSVSNLTANIQFMYYGQFVDMGVGKGTKLGDVSFDRRFRGTGSESSRRRAKKWFSPVMYHEVNRLGELASEITGQKASASITETLPSTIVL